MLKVEGTRGAAVLTLGVNIDYPTGTPDHLVVAFEHRCWTQMCRCAARGSPRRSRDPMSNLQRFVAGEDPALVSPVADAIKTMALVEACYQSSARGGTPIPAIA